MSEYTNKIQKLLKAYLKKHESNIKPNNQKADRDCKQSQNGKDCKARKS